MICWRWLLVLLAVSFAAGYLVGQADKVRVERETEVRSEE
jgi:hypothetical protein